MSRLRERFIPSALPDFLDLLEEALLLEEDDDELLELLLELLEEEEDDEELLFFFLCLGGLLSYIINPSRVFRAIAL